VTRYFITSPLFAGFLGAGGTLLLLYAAPGGLVAVVAQMRDAVLRVVAQRRQMVVPSLFADYDPDVLARRLIPMAEPASGSGLSALPVSARFSLKSGLYQGRGQRIFGPATGNGKDSETKEAVAIGAAASRVESET
jgi:hypothetical protein